MGNAMVCLPLAVALVVGASADRAPCDRDKDVSRQPKAPAAAAWPPIAISVYAEPTVPPAAVRRMLAEADEIWKSNGVRFLWRPAAARVAPYAQSSEAGRYQPSTLRVTVDDLNRDSMDDGTTPLGWIRFDHADEPDQEIHVSYGNARALLAGSPAIVGDVSSMPTLQREIYLGRAMGRALAHELGHYLLGSKAHAARGLMRALRPAREFFAPRARFDIDETQKKFVALRLGQILMLARSSADPAR
jgi:hypothetical protein